jgi:stalled ribosome rescue protein Dom34
MKKDKNLGIWMDHSNAFLMEFSDNKIITNYIVSEASQPEKEFNQNKSEKLKHTKEQHLQSGYYKKLGESIRDFQKVVLFGPTDAKNELLNILRCDHLFDKIKIDTVDSDKMTENQMHTFILDYFGTGSAS